MVKTARESEIYLRYFYTNKGLIFLPSLLSSLLVFLLTQNAPIKYRQSLLYEVRDLDITRRVVLSDQIVAQMRQQNIKQMFGSSETKIYKSGPYLLTLIVEDKEEVKAADRLNDLGQYMETEFPLIRLGEKISTAVRPPVFAYTILAAAAGFITGNIFTLIKLYCRKY